MKARLFLLTATLYMPMAATLTQFGVRNFVFVHLLTLVPVIVALVALSKKEGGLLLRTSPFRSFIVLFIGLVFFQLVLLLSNPREALHWSVGYALSFALIAYLSRIEQKEMILLLERMFAIIGIVFLLQILGSAYESYQGSLLAGGALLDEQMEPNVGLEGTDFENRIIFSLFTSELGPLSEFKLPFSGLIGQHNYWGTQLPFYNLVFLYQYHTSRKKRWIVLSALCLLANIFNTTRFGIAAIILSDALVFFRETKGRWKPLKALLGMITIVALWKVGDVLINVLYEYYSKTNTLSFRLDLYVRTLDYYLNQDILRMVFGAGSTGIPDLARVGIGSFESEFFNKLLYTGLAGFTLFAIFLLRLTKQSSRMVGFPRFMAQLIVLNILAVSLISNLVFVYSIAGVVTLLYVYNMEQSVIEGVRE